MWGTHLSWISYGEVAIIFWLLLPWIIMPKCDSLLVVLFQFRLMLSIVVYLEVSYTWLMHNCMLQHSLYLLTQLLILLGPATFVSWLDNCTVVSPSVFECVALTIAHFTQWIWMNSVVCTAQKCQLISYGGGTESMELWFRVVCFTLYALDRKGNAIRNFSAIFIRKSQWTHSHITVFFDVLHAWLWRKRRAPHSLGCSTWKGESG